MSSPAVPVRLVGRNRVEFRFDPGVWGARRPSSVRLTGSFSAWQPAQNLKKGLRTWTLTLPLEAVAVPGNSGEPEFRFVSDEDVWLACPDVEGWPRVGDNAVVPVHRVPAGLRESRHRTAGRLKVRLEEYATPRELANFRAVVPGRLFRSYHPFLASRETPVEGPRLKAAARLLEEYGIGSVINLTDSPGVLGLAGVPPVYAALARRRDVLFAETTYEDAYYRPDGPGFGAVAARIVEFVANRPGPYLVHCRLGMDRTGVVSALLGGLGGVSWPALAADYQKSNTLGIREYRDEGLLAYSLAQMTGQDPAGAADLRSALEQFCLRHGVSRATLDRAQRNLR